VCVEGSTGDSLQKTIAALDAIADLGLKLSTALIGFGAALLIGLKSGGMSLTFPVRIAVFISMLMFTQSALYAIWWRIRIANSWFNECLNTVTEPSMQRIYESHMILFATGVLSLIALFLVALAQKPNAATVK
jgi:hypothetical protein